MMNWLQVKEERQAAQHAAQLSYHDEEVMVELATAAELAGASTFVGECNVHTLLYLLYCI